MAKAKNKTTKTELSVDDYFASIEDKSKRDDCLELAKMMETASGKKPKMWGTSIVGFDQYHLIYKSGRELDWMRIGFSARKNYISVYVMDGIGKYDVLVKKLGKFKHGKSCLNIKRLSDIDTGVLAKIIVESLMHFRKKYGPVSYTHLTLPTTPYV